MPSISATFGSSASEKIIGSCCFLHTEKRASLFADATRADFLSIAHNLNPYLLLDWKK